MPASAQEHASRSRSFLRESSTFFREERLDRAIERLWRGMEEALMAVAASRRLDLRSDAGISGYAGVLFETMDQDSPYLAAYDELSLISANPNAYDLIPQGWEPVHVRISAGVRELLDLAAGTSRH